MWQQQETESPPPEEGNKRPLIINRVPKYEQQISEIKPTQENTRMKGSKLLVGVLLCVMVSLGACRTREPRMRSLTRARQCRIQQLSSVQPNDRIQSEGGMIELWDDKDEQFQCAGVSAMRVTIQPNSLSLPAYYSAPRLVYIEQGQGVMGMSLPGCPETYHAGGMQMRGDEEGDESRRRMRDMHQPTRRFRKGDIVAVPHGTVHWAYNDGDEDLVVVAVHNLNTDANQLDETLRTFMLAGGVQGGQQNIQNILQGFDPQLLAEAMGSQDETVRQIQEGGERGPIVQAKEMRQMMTPPRFERRGDEEEEDEREYKRGSRGSACTRQGGCSTEMEAENGLEETFCNMRFRHNVDSRMEADIFSRDAGRINVVNQNKLPILGLLDMSAEKGHLLPNAIYAPHWSSNGHSMVYVTRGEAQLQIVDNNGETVFDDTMREGEMVVIPQFYISTCRGGRDGLEYVSFKTTANPMRSQLNGHASVFNAMPVPVISNSYEISHSDAFQLKRTRGQQQALFSPLQRRS